MSHKISVYLDDQTHRELKAAASRQGLSLSDFMTRRPKRRCSAHSVRKLPALWINCVNRSPSP